MTAVRRALRIEDSGEADCYVGLRILNFVARVFDRWSIRGFPSAEPVRRVTSLC